MQYTTSASDWLRTAPHSSPSHLAASALCPQIIPNFRVGTIPVLGTMPALFGMAAASYILCHLAGAPWDGEASWPVIVLPRVLVLFFATSRRPVRPWMMNAGLLLHGLLHEVEFPRGVLLALKIARHQ